MTIPPEITFRGVPKTEAVESFILDKAAQLDKLHDGIVSCRLAVEKDGEQQRSGSPYRVRLVVRIPPNKELVFSREPGEGEGGERLTNVIAAAFDAVRRQLVKAKEKQHGHVKSHPSHEQMIGHVVRIFPAEGYGFIRAADGRELFFHRNAVTQDDFDRLEVGTGVRYFPSEGEKGPQASTLQIVDKPGSQIPAGGESHVEMPGGWEQ